MRAQIFSLLAAIAACIPQFALAGDKNATDLHHLASEFVAVCIRTKATREKVIESAQLRGWRSRPGELSTFDEIEADLAWDGDLSSIKTTGPELSASPFAVTFGERSQRATCSFVFPAAPIDALKTVLAAQGFSLIDEGELDLGSGRKQAAAFCFAGDAADQSVHEVEATTGKIRGWPSDMASRLTYRRVSGTPQLGPGAAIGFSENCPIVETVYDFMDIPPALPEIDPLLGEKPDTVPELSSHPQ